MCTLCYHVVAFIRHNCLYVDAASVVFAGAAVACGFGVVAAERVFPVVFRSTIRIIVVIFISDVVLVCVSLVFMRTAEPLL